jgi:chromatin remodeling complex protein RSC6
MSKVTTSKTATKTTRTKSTPKPKELVETVVETVVETPVETVVETPVEETLESESMKQRFEKLIKTKQDQMNDLKREIQELRKMQRDHEHAVKDASKRSRKKKVRDETSTRKPSGFASPVVVSDELYAFLAPFGVKNGDPIARTDVTRYITTYIKDHDLQNPEHRREIVPDAVLKSLFGPAMEPKDPNDASSPLVYTYLKLQRYLSQHFPKKATA